MFFKAINKVKCNLANPFIYKSKYLATREVPKFDPSKDYYQILELPKEANDLQIKKSYYKLAKSFHPDVNPGKQLNFKEVTEAYFVLSHPTIKKQYLQARLSKLTKNKVVQKNPNSKVQQNLKTNLSPQEKKKMSEQNKRKMWNQLIFWAIFTIIVIFAPEQKDAPVKRHDIDIYRSEPTENEAKMQIQISQQYTSSQSNYQYLPSYDYECESGQETQLEIQSSEDNSAFLLPDYSNSEAKQ